MHIKNIKTICKWFLLIYWIHEESGNLTEVLGSVKLKFKILSQTPELDNRNIEIKGLVAMLLSMLRSF